MTLILITHHDTIYTYTIFLSIGIIAITNVPKLQVTRRVTLSSVGDCIRNHIIASTTSDASSSSSSSSPPIKPINTEKLSDGSLRHTLAMQYQHGIRDSNSNNNNNNNNPSSSSHLNEFYKQCYGLNDSITDLRDIIDDISYSLADALDEAFLPPHTLVLNTKIDNQRINNKNDNSNNNHNDIKKDDRSIAAHHVDTSTTSTTTSMTDYKGIDDSGIDVGGSSGDRMSSYLGISKDIHRPFFMDHDYHDYYHRAVSHGESSSSSSSSSNSSKLLGENEIGVVTFIHHIIT